MFNWIIYIILLVFAVIFFVLSYQFHKQKWGNLIAGYNDLSKKEKSIVDFKPISQSASKCSFVGGIYVLFMFFFIYSLLENTIKTAVLLFLLPTGSLAFIIFIVVEIRKSRKFYK
ncbi:DUF3784 domain-containing protein [Enterococcus hulanensis]|uniref:DUF3784 domain-containing protein n=1 Tax=Enterococcus TaxID=1350 RepID=UPI000B5ABBEB|nr:DUF3784 domain-containing protein [Enterococcus hulanensis]OTO21069.1 hypothetical protein A5875_002441 [Enterococcus sp. 3H8_DIV0648]